MVSSQRDTRKEHCIEYAASLGRYLRSTVLNHIFPARSVAKRNADFESNALGTVGPDCPTDLAVVKTRPVAAWLYLPAALQSRIYAPPEASADMLEKVMGQVSIHNLPQSVRSCFATPHPPGPTSFVTS